MVSLCDATIHPPHYVNIQFDHDWSGMRPLINALKVDPEVNWVPTSGCSEKPRKRMPDVLGRWEVLLVNERVREIIESMEPQTHQFFPFEMRNGPKGEACEVPYFVLNIRHMLDCVHAERTACDRNGTGWTEFYSPIEYKHLILDEEVVQGHHLWRTRYVHHGFFVSDELMSRFERAKVKGLDCSHKIGLARGGELSTC